MSDAVADRRRGAFLIAGLDLLRLGQIDERELRNEVRHRREGHAARRRVEAAGVNVPSILVRLSAVKGTCLDAHESKRDAGGDDVVGDVRRVLKMMTEDGLGNLQRRFAMRISDRSNGRISDWREVQKSRRAIGDRMRVLRSELHEEIVRMLSV